MALITKAKKLLKLQYVTGLPHAEAKNKTNLSVWKPCNIYKVLIK